MVRHVGAPIGRINCEFTAANLRSMDVKLITVVQMPKVSSSNAAQCRPAIESKNGKSGTPKCEILAYKCEQFWTDATMGLLDC